MAVTTNAGGGGGIDPDELTALPDDVIKGKIAGVKGSDEPVTGTLELSGNAADSHVLANKEFYNTDPKQKRIGTMANNPAPTASLNCGQSKTVPAGFNPGGVITANSLASQTPGNAVASDIMSGKTATVNGAKVIGTKPNNGAMNASLNCGQSKSIPAGHTEGGTVTANSLASQTGGASADDSRVQAGYTYWKDGVKRTGNMTVQSIINFNVALYATRALIGAWANPSRGPYSGVRIMAVAGRYANDVNDGTCVYDGSGNSFIWSNLSAGTMYYFRAFSFVTTNYGRIYNADLEWGRTAWTATPQNIQGQQTFTSSGVFTVPAGVRQIQIFCVGGGGSGLSYGTAGGGGGGGYTQTGSFGVAPGQQLAVVIGNGSSVYESPGESTYVSGLISASGGNCGSGSSFGGNGGSGGGDGWRKMTGVPSIGGDGGSDGRDGGVQPETWGTGGKGQGTTTRAFGEAGNTLYAGGGAGYYGKGGAGGGGNGSGISTGFHGTPGTGGGGAGRSGAVYGQIAGKGGSGICLIRWGY